MLIFRDVQLMVTPNMEPKNDGFHQKESTFPETDLQVPCLNFKGVSSILVTILWMRSLSPSIITNRITNQWLSISIGYHLEIRSSMCILLGLMFVGFQMPLPDPLETRVIFSCVRIPSCRIWIKPRVITWHHPRQCSMIFGKSLKNWHTFGSVWSPRN